MFEIKTVTTEFMDTFLKNNTFFSDCGNENTLLYCKGPCKNFNIKHHQRIGAASVYGIIYNTTCEDKACGPDDQVCESSKCSYVAKWISTIPGMSIINPLDNPLTEAEIQSRASDIDIAPVVYQVLICPSGALIIMDKMDQTLGEKLLKRGVTLAEKKQLIEKAFRCVDKLHNLGYVHRDTHLNNFMIDSNGNVKIIDFGLAHEIDEFASLSDDYSKIVLGVKEHELEKFAIELFNKRNEQNLYQKARRIAIALKANKNFGDEQEKRKQARRAIEEVRKQEMIMKHAREEKQVYDEQKTTFKRKKRNLVLAEPEKPKEETSKIVKELEDLFYTVPEQQPELSERVYKRKKRKVVSPQPLLLKPLIKENVLERPEHAGFFLQLPMLEEQVDPLTELRTTQYEL
jgi:serine/threonine protein kinase